MDSGGSLPAWGVWIEIIYPFVCHIREKSLPAWGVWIEIRQLYREFWWQDVTPRMGSVD